MNYFNKSDQIKAGVIEGFQNGKSKYAMRRCYGYNISKDGSLVINPKEAFPAEEKHTQFLSICFLKRITAPVGREQR